MTAPLRAPHTAVAVARLCLLKSFSLTFDGRLMAIPASAQRVLAFVALHGGPIKRVQLAETLWIDVPEERANGSLRTALWRLRRLGSPGIEASPSELSLSDRVEVDYAEQMSRIERILRGRSMYDDDIDELCGAGELLPAWYDDWVLAERERFRQLRMLGLEQLSERLAAEERTSEATQVALAAVVSDPLRESAQCALINAHLARGNVADAIRQYGIYRRLLATELGLQPSSEMQDLIARGRGDAVVTRG